MTYTYRLNDIELNKLGIINNTFKISNSIEDKLKLENFSLDVWNKNKALNPYNPHSMFYNRRIDQFKIEVEYLNEKYFTGNLKGLSIDENTNIASIEFGNSYSNIFEKIVEYITTSDQNKTAPQIISDLLLLYNLKHLISPKIHNYESLFNNLYFCVNVLYEANENLGDLIQQLSESCFSEIYLSNGKINLWFPDSSYFHLYSYVIDENDLSEGIKASISYDDIINNYIITLDNFTLEDQYYSNVGKESREYYGKKEVNINLKSDNNISVPSTSDSVTSLVTLANRWLEYKKDPSLIIELSIKINSHKYVELGSQLKINVKPYENMVFRVYSYELDNEKQVYNLKLRRIY